MKKERLKKKIRLLLIPLLLLTVTLIGCTTIKTPTSISGSTPELSGAIKVIGSNTVTPLSAVWAEDFMKKYPKVNIAVSGPGSGAGIAALIDKTTDICQASRKMTQAEIDKAKTNGVNPYEIQVASDGLAVVVHPSNSINELTIVQLSGIYTGKITNWKEVGGKDATIVVLSRDTNSGTHVFFKEHVVQMLGLHTADKKLEYGTNVLLLPSTEIGVTETAKNPNAIFYPGLGYVTPQIKVLGIKSIASDGAVKPSVTTVLNGTYPISRPLLFYTNGQPTGVIKAFVDYCLSAEGQKVVTDIGYVPLSR